MTPVVEDALSNVSPSFLQKLIDAAAAIDEVPKDGTNAFHNYKYSSIEAIVRRTRVELLKRQILVFAGEDTTDDRLRQTNQGESAVTTVHLIYTVMDAETGERFEVPWIGRGDDPADKGVSKALTDARKTFLLQLLQIPRGDDTEGDPTTDERTYTSGGVNLQEQAKGLNNAQINAVLVQHGLSASQKPWGALRSIPSEVAEQVSAALEAEHQR
jgi:hypothetical protein